jgi:hypothetical protein
MISPKGSQLAPLNEASRNRRIGLKLSGEVSIVMRRSHRRVKSLEIGRLPHDVVARSLPHCLRAWTTVAASPKPRASLASTNSVADTYLEVSSFHAYPVNADTHYM